MQVTKTYTVEWNIIPISITVPEPVREAMERYIRDQKTLGAVRVWREYAGSMELQTRESSRSMSCWGAAAPERRLWPEVWVYLQSLKIAKALVDQIKEQMDDGH